jgi:Na+-translocating ferredoxin:NAD+ oxidoreductase RnfG subunit
MAGCAALVGLLVAPPGAGAKVFYSRSEALEMAFPEADHIEAETFVLADDQVSQIEELAKSRVDSKLVKIYKGLKDGELLGYAVIDVHRVRTLPEAFMVVIDPQGSVRSLRVLAFHEPLDYLPTGRWYEQFGDKGLEAPLRVGGDIHGVVGATLSAHATTSGVRRALAYYRVLIQNGH